MCSSVHVRCNWTTQYVPRDLGCRDVVAMEYADEIINNQPSAGEKSPIEKSGGRDLDFDMYSYGCIWMRSCRF